MNLTIRFKKKTFENILRKNENFYSDKERKKRQATYITPLRPFTFAAFPPWRIQQELVV